MNVKTLIDLLQKMDPERIVVLAKDSEGNNYQPASNSIGELSYWDGEVYLEKLTPELKQQGYTEEDVRVKGCYPSVVLWPC